MKGKISLRDWAQISEIIASLGVIVSLVFLVFSIDRNTVELQAQNINDLYDSLREIEMTVLGDADLAEIVRRVEAGEFERLDEKDQFRYTVFVTQHLSIWEQMWDRVQDGSVGQLEYAASQEYFTVYFAQHLPPEVWEWRRGWFTDPAFQSEVESQLDSYRSDFSSGSDSGE